MTNGFTNYTFYRRDSGSYYYYHSQSNKYYPAYPDRTFP